MYLFGSLITVLALCMAHISGSTVFILTCLGAFIVMLGVGCMHNFTLPLLLFFLPWSALLKNAPGEFSFYTIALVMLSFISAVKNWFRFRRYHIVCGILLTLITLLAKIIHSSAITLDYICFMMMILLFPVITEETAEGRYSFYDAVMFLALGIISAALCAQWFAAYSNISAYISVYSYSSIVRRCGFYNDPNFYSAHILAAISACLVLLQRQKMGWRFFTLAAVILLLAYCGFLSGSKSFVLVGAVIIILWVISIMKMRGQSGMKIAIIVAALLAGFYIVTADIFKSLIAVVDTRLSNSADMDAFTTGRTELWQSYFTSIIYDFKVMLIGKGFTNVKINAKASHNTLIQMVFQFGVIGAPILMGWIVCFYNRIREQVKAQKKQLLQIVIILTGAFLPWMAIDILFFDEFFLFQWFTLIGISAIISNDENRSDLPEDRV